MATESCPWGAGRPCGVCEICEAARRKHHLHEARRKLYHAGVLTIEENHTIARKIDHPELREP